MNAGAAAQKQNAAAFSFGDVQYFHRFTNRDQHEYTPLGQEDLNRWADMVTINFYPNAKDGAALATIANTVLETYKAGRGLIIRTDSVPATKARPAEHLIVVSFGRPEFIEVAFARFRMHEGAGTSVVYSHRVYGNRVGNEMSAWLQKNGPDVERKLMSWNAMPDQIVRK
jgi:hypothetical protein